ncbi:HK97 family phage major capsid protein [Paenibacillus sp. 4624]|uniref:phage major capsid protein n=1 Tax=Paenibacillus sp. 4624 TaxID=3156453 RepID=UPI003D223806
MALRQIMLAKKIKQRKAELEGFLEQERSIKVRSEELEQAIEEATTEEEIKTVEESIEAHEQEKEELAASKSTLEGEIAELERELAEVNSKEPNNTPPPANNEQRQQQHSQGGEIRMKVNKGFFKGMERSAAEAIIQRREVKDFLDKVRSGDIPNEKNLNKRGVTGGELGIPDVILGLIRDNLHRYSKLISKVNLKSIPGTSRTNIVGDIPEAIWTEACATLNELELRFYQVETDGYKVGGFIPICNALLEDSDFNLGNEIMDALGQALGLGVDKAILYGTGVKMPIGIVTRLAETAKPSYWGVNYPTWTNLSSSNIGQVAKGNDSKEFFANLIRFSGKAKSNYGNGGKFWAMNDTTYTELQARLVEFNAAGAIIASINNVMPIINGDIVILPFMAEGDIVGGYGSQYLLAERSGSQFAVSEHVQFIQDNTVFKATARYDGKPIMGQGFVAMNITGVAPKTTMTFAPDTANDETETPDGA